MYNSKSVSYSKIAKSVQALWSVLAVSSKQKPWLRRRSEKISEHVSENKMAISILCFAQDYYGRRIFLVIAEHRAKGRCQYMLMQGPRRVVLMSISLFLVLLHLQLLRGL
uniref:Uncharacterized protein n=1 Tax=Cannabis sativa TaxID=3483 RepID=A0A803R551_CANSA